MKKRIKIPGNKYNKYALLKQQQNLIEQHYDFLNCYIKRNLVLVCTGRLNLYNCSTSYSIKIEYVAGFEPKSTIVSPVIEPCKEIHMYRDHSLCLHYSPDMIWNEKTKIYQYTIPWISEWILYHETYLLNGNIWEGPESPSHFSESEKNINRNPLGT